LNGEVTSSSTAVYRCVTSRISQVAVELIQIGGHRCDRTCTQSTLDPLGAELPIGGSNLGEDDQVAVKSDRSAAEGHCCCRGVGPFRVTRRVKFPAHGPMYGRPLSACPPIVPMLRPARSTIPRGCSSPSTTGSAACSTSLARDLDQRSGSPRAATHPTQETAGASSRKQWAR
jgi:hypothetical protein